MLVVIVRLKLLLLATFVAQFICSRSVQGSLNWHGVVKEAARGRRNRWCPSRFDTPLLKFTESIAALSKLEESQKEPKEGTAPPPKHDGPTAGLESEVDKMLQEFAKMMPGTAAADELKGNKTSSEQIEETFKKLMQEPLDSGFGQNMDDVDLGELGDMNKVIEQMMAELTSKEILYEPFSEMIAKYPEWIRENEDKLEDEPLKNYREQLRVASLVVALFDKSDYEARKSDYQAQIFELMQTMQEFGPPPDGLLAAEPGKPEDNDEDGLTEEERASLPNCNQM